MPTADARDVAMRVIERVLTQGAYLAPTLDAELVRANLAARDAALATELAYGVVRTLGWLETRIDASCASPVWKKRPGVRVALLVGAYSLLFLERVPSFAAVNEAVRAVERAADRRVAGFANAVLRKLAATDEGRVDIAAAAEASLPAFLRDAFRAVGLDVADLLRTAELPPPVCLCLRRDEARPQWVADLARARPGARVTAGRLSPRAILLRGAGDPRALPGADDAWSVQEEGAQAVALAAGARTGERVLDACAGRGQKSRLLGEAVGASGVVDACDLHPGKLDRIGPPSAGANAGQRLFAVDWTRGTGDVPDGYDRALVDAPCTGSGTLARRPEIALRLGPTKVAELVRVQLAITRRVASRIRPDGRLIYAVCSVLREECEDVVSALCEGTAEAGVRLETCPFDGDFGRALASGRHDFRLSPSIHGTDGYYVASFRVVAP